MPQVYLTMPKPSVPTDHLAQIERLIRISNEHPLLPEIFIPWNTAEREEHIFLTEKLVSLSNHPVYSALTTIQKRELARREVVQAMYGYCWSEGLFCLFMTRYILHRAPDDPERRFLLREIVEESRHQEMFADTIKKLGRKPVPLTRFHRWLGGVCVKLFPPDFAFLSCLAVEMMADRYGDHLRKEPGIFPVLQKVAQLHNIEEARHILFTKMLLKRYTDTAGFWRSTMYSLVVLLNMRFFQSTYVRAEIYRDIGVPNPVKVRRQAFADYQRRFAAECLDSLQEFVNSFNGFNVLTRSLWRRVMKIQA